MSRNKVLLLCAATMLALAVNAHGQSPAQAKTVNEACSRWFKPLDVFQVISDDNYDQAIIAWKQVSGFLPQRIDSLADATGLSFQETYKLVESHYMNHPFMAKKKGIRTPQGQGVDRESQHGPCDNRIIHEGSDLRSKGGDACRDFVCR